jgi:hypothetical protein
VFYSQSLSQCLCDCLLASSHCFAILFSPSLSLILFFSLLCSLSAYPMSPSVSVILSLPLSFLSLPSSLFISISAVFLSLSFSRFQVLGVSD